jgi:hypothetical protein
VASRSPHLAAIAAFLAGAWPARAMFEAAGIASLALPAGLALRALAICGPRTSVIRRATPTVHIP